MSRRGDVAGLLVGGVIAVVCVRLGVWQLSRLRERRALNHELRSRGELPPVELGHVPVTGDSMRWRHVHATGVYDYSHERVWTNRSFDGVPGIALLTPLRLANGTAVFVDRGWVPSADAVKADPAQWRERDSADVTGLAFPIPRARSGSTAPPDSFPYQMLPFMVETVTPARPATPGGSTPIRWPVPELDDGPHLSYAIQWFAFALISAIGSVIVVWKRRNQVEASI